MLRCVQIVPLVTSKTTFFNIVYAILFSLSAAFDSLPFLKFLSSSALGRHDDSLRLWTAVNPSPTDLSARLHLALALFRAGKYTESLQGQLSWGIYTAFLTIMS